jgi:L-rhamnose mutarotase
MIQSIAFTMKIMPVSEEEYRPRHQQVWPDLLADLKQTGCSRYSIYLRGLDLFAFMEGDDFQRYLSLLATIQAARRWEERMSDILILEVDPATGFPNVFLKCLIWIEPWILFWMRGSRLHSL